MYSSSHSPVSMKCSILKPQFILLVTYVILIAHTLAEPSQEAKINFIAWRQRYHEARLSARTNRKLIGTNELSYTWAGAAQTAPSADHSFASVTGEWIIPSVSLPTGALYPNNDYNMAEWVGIDGRRGSRCEDIIFQAGVYSYIRTDGNGNELDRGVLVWVEWFPNPADFSPNYPVAVGDRIKVSLVVNSPAKGQVTFSNPDKPGADELVITVPAPNNDVLICGGSAEWIMEDAHAKQAPGSLLNFGKTSMVNCAAGLVQGNTIKDINLDGATFLDLYENKNLLLAKTTKVSSTELAFRYAGSF